MVVSTQRAAQASLEWFENIGQYAGQDPHQFAFNIVILAFPGAGTGFGIGGTGGGGLNSIIPQNLSF